MKVVKVIDIVSMTSKEIAEVTGKQHKHVLRDIRVMLAQLESSPKLDPMENQKLKRGVKGGPTLRYDLPEGITHETDKAGNTKQFILDKAHTFVLVAGYDAKLRLAAWNYISKLEQHILEANASRDKARMEFRPLTDAVKRSREEQGKEVEHYHYSNEANLINRIVLGVSASQFRKLNNLDSVDATRDHLTVCQVKAIEALQKADTAFLDMDWSYEQRKEALQLLFDRRHREPLLEESKKLDLE